MSEIKKLYKGLFLKHGDSPYAIKARDKKQQYKRFANLIRCCDLKKGDTVLDLGCATGELYEFLKKYKIKKYCGVDFVDMFIKTAKKKYSKNKKLKFIQLDFEKKNIPKGFDWVFLSGTFNDKKKNSKAFMKKTLIKMFKTSKKGIVFNSLSTHVDYRDKELFYSSPEETLNFCVKNLSKYFIIRSDYQLKKNTLPFEYSMCIKKIK